MRNVVSISLPDDLLADLHKQAKEEKYSSLSEYVRYLIREHRKATFWREIEESRKEFLAGKGILLKKGSWKEMIEKHL